jgi:hypothetical protein
LDVLYDLAAWFEGVGGDPAAVMAAKNLLHVDSRTPATNFVALAMRMIQIGDLTYAGAGCGNADIMEKERNRFRPAAVMIPVNRINEILIKKRAPEVDLGPVANELKYEDAWLGSRRDGRGFHWRVRADWWNRCLKRLGIVL